MSLPGVDWAGAASVCNKAGSGHVASRASNSWLARCWHQWLPFFWLLCGDKPGNHGQQFGNENNPLLSACLS
jgi:hypothetical protein